LMVFLASHSGRMNLGADELDILWSGIVCC
jgi:hypothetical protein